MNLCARSCRFLSVVSFPLSLFLSFRSSVCCPRPQLTASARSFHSSILRVQLRSERCLVCVRADAQIEFVLNGIAAPNVMSVATIKEQVIHTNTQLSTHTADTYRSILPETRPIILFYFITLQLFHYFVSFAFSPTILALISLRRPFMLILFLLSRSTCVTTVATFYDLN